MTINQSMAGLCLVALLSACGGGGGGGTTGINGTSFPNASIYAGTWIGVCGNQNRDTLAITESNGQLVGSQIAEYFGSAGCTGPVLATETSSASGTMTYVNTVPASVVLSQFGTPSSIQVDQVTVVLPQNFTSVTGPGVAKVVNNGKPQWCFSTSNGGSTCIDDQGVQPGKTSTGALFTQGNQLFELNMVNGVYTVGLLFTKK